MIIFWFADSLTRPTSRRLQSVRSYGNKSSDGQRAAGQFPWRPSAPTSNDERRGPTFGCTLEFKYTENEAYRKCPGTQNARLNRGYKEGSRENNQRTLTMQIACRRYRVSKRTCITIAEHSTGWVPYYGDVFKCALERQTRPCFQIIQLARV